MAPLHAPSFATRLRFLPLLLSLLLLLPIEPSLANADVARSSDVAESRHELERRRSLLFSRCSKSGIRGFTSSKRLTGGLFLHWRATTKGSKKVNLALLATTGSLAAHGWFSAGWSPDGKMGGSNVIVMDSPSSPPVTADLIGHAVSGSPATWTAADTSVTRNNMGIIMRKDPHGVGVWSGGLESKWAACDQRRNSGEFLLRLQRPVKDLLLNNSSGSWNEGAS
ncbi:unnamed protein product [Closterium sp. Naga37s-1]|nr:unnamed protein product [Closterium sp. Naga37s-1]